MCAERNPDELWTADELRAIRAVSRTGGSIAEAMAAVNSKWTHTTFRRRCKKAGIVFAKPISKLLTQKRHP